MLGRLEYEMSEIGTCVSGFVEYLIVLQDISVEVVNGRCPEYRFVSLVPLLS